ncbi:hypothetical protein [Sediminicoccus sp. KRV36]|uniref:hypothetical protein n=1 Tax=Sediminicoccus sp. KRV36 TaxID=3133721 RepID=UPI0020105B47|nr:hypothetical protein [Sediminicoccus rosea]UPY37135.1 hypothetical protein LHU95_00110 [Sediminicoccus rosea]
MKSSVMALLAAGVLLGACTPDTRQPVASGPVASGIINCDTSIRFVNNSSATVFNLHYTPTSIGNWGPDRLGQNVLRPGAASNVRLANARPYDFRVVWQNGRAAEIRNVDICRASQISITNAGLRAL